MLKDESQTKKKKKKYTQGAGADQSDGRYRC